MITDLNDSSVLTLHHSMGKLRMSLAVRLIGSLVPGRVAGRGPVLMAVMRVAGRGQRAHSCAEGRKEGKGRKGKVRGVDTCL